MAFLIFSILFLPLVSATSYVSFSALGSSPETVMITYANGTPVGTYNTSSTLISLPDGNSYAFLLVPSDDNLLANHPDTWFSTVIAKFSQNSAVYIVIIFCLVMLGIVISRNR